MPTRLIVKVEPRPPSRALPCSKLSVRMKRGRMISMLIAFFFVNSAVGGR
jgi:hypothetical protein